jgi:hypothetical protein
MFLRHFVDDFTIGYNICSDQTVYFEIVIEKVYKTSQGSYKNYLGNYWDDYTGTDSDGDGIGDTPYSVVSGQNDNYPLIEPFENYIAGGENQPPTCIIELRKNEVPIDEINIEEFFDICIIEYSKDIQQVRFLSDENQNGIVDSGFTWTKWYDWRISEEGWNADSKIREWVFYSPGIKEVWVEVKDTVGQTSRCNVDIYVLKSSIILTIPLVISPVKDYYYIGEILTSTFTIKNVRDYPITLDILTVGGRLNGQCTEDGCPDFTHKYINLIPNQEYQYEGIITLNEVGNYRFFIAYYIENPSPNENKSLD